MRAITSSTALRSSFRGRRDITTMSNQTNGVISVIRDLLEHDASFFRIAMGMQEPHRSRMMSNHSRMTHEVLNILKEIVIPTRPLPRFVVNIPLRGTGHQTAFDDVLVTPTPAQMEDACEHDVTVEEGVCAVCQESVTLGTRLRNCLHTFHRGCITNWFAMSSRCPVCRDDVRERRREDHSEPSVSDERSHLSPY